MSLQKQQEQIPASPLGLSTYATADIQGHCISASCNNPNWATVIIIYHGEVCLLFSSLEF